MWQALTDADLTARYWGHANVSDWQPGSTWEHRRVDGSGVIDVVGKVLEAEPPTRLVHHLRGPADGGAAEPSVVTFLVEPHQDIVRLTVTHENLPDQEMLTGISQRLAGGAGEPQVAARDRRRASAGAMGDVTPRTPEATPDARLSRAVRTAGPPRVIDAIR